jgi:ankyrin repeat protein
MLECNDLKEVIDEPISDGNTPLMLAIDMQRHKPEEKHRIIQKLIDKGANLFKKDNHGWSLLHKAVKERDLKLMELILECNQLQKVINEPISNGKTPLMLAINIGGNKKYPIIQKLIGNGANLFEKDNDGCSVLHIAVLKEDPKLLELILELMLDYNKLQEFINQTDNNENTPLMLAMNIGKNENEEKHSFFQKLVDNGANLFKKNNRGYSALHIAVKQADIKLMELILECDELQEFINETDNNGNTPLMLAMDIGKNKCEKRYCIFQKLVDNGANLFKKNNDGKNPADFARHLLQIPSSFPEVLNENGLISINYSALNTLNLLEKFEKKHLEYRQRLYDNYNNKERLVNLANFVTSNIASSPKEFKEEPEKNSDQQIKAVEKNLSVVKL